MTHTASSSGLFRLLWAKKFGDLKIPKKINENRNLHSVIVLIDRVMPTAEGLSCCCHYANAMHAAHRRKKSDMAIAGSSGVRNSRGELAAQVRFVANKQQKKTTKRSMNEQEEWGGE